MKLSKQLRVFLLYAHSDKRIVRRLYRHLVKAGVNTWLDEEKLLPGQDWEYEIHNAICRSDVVIVCLSKRFIRQGGYRHEELKIAVEKAKSLPAGEIFLIPVRLEKCDMPQAVRRWQRVDLFEPYGYKPLMKALKEYVNSTWSSSIK